MPLTYLTLYFLLVDAVLKNSSKKSAVSAQIFIALYNRKCLSFALLIF